MGLYGWSVPVLVLLRPVLGAGSYFVAYSGVAPNIPRQAEGGKDALPCQSSHCGKGERDPGRTVPPPSINSRGVRP